MPKIEIKVHTDNGGLLGTELFIDRDISPMDCKDILAAYFTRETDTENIFYEFRSNKLFLPTPLTDFVIGELIVGSISHMKIEANLKQVVDVLDSEMKRLINDEKIMDTKIQLVLSTD